MGKKLPKHILTFSGVRDAEKAKGVKDCLIMVPGVLGVSIDKDDNSIHIEYDKEMFKPLWIDSCFKKYGLTFMDYGSTDEIKPEVQPIEHSEIIF